ncbi:DMSO/TMAO reductase YedYZ molybdopterin-dependent catalytic subunit [Halarchaeum rubridurum]|uniref:DMSO/TMAO reductase YedYZ molybdopterin-dependent catalytic subunit n=1 Tax=Halarchaeum rubridurum TaxID=489911 RepID=A0A830G3P3_9EURY|nr:sulfite oxidase-like oxidoreductase [Halarchaeum rubridurum]MBP1955594.1 DMSO/TMAO reductase YedYZ molybdopterin-dependent catalytic subunit [Halarchaeum rubridurum]GGM73599.1 sulfite oxidase [Halarchaeum rubridurum]
MDETDVRDVTGLYREFGDARLPPGQREVERFPVLSMGGTPNWDPERWRFDVDGAVETPRSFTWDEFRDLPSETQRQDFHCVTGWSTFDCEFTGVSATTLLDAVGVESDAVHVMFHALDGYTTDLPLDAVARDEVLFAWGYDGDALPREHGGPLRVVTPHKYAYKGAKWVDGVTLLTEPERGYWEQRGYSVSANPWAEERYS